ncbi:hypothetical protein MAPG_05798 [Magnaporthiopsis poae ATCC 64411]|uniref:Uncharacterized protein n=1 Tax=Magnaporthiopsis poae (strain ATCC 64411 / 73-15) TaxID=644358 RepID=A0A0C4E0C6_MAGP6|nr:hypothetical protein MAPG_05798 [Magnaporthiopsis poae ATCC 64411]
MVNKGARLAEPRYRRWITRGKSMYGKPGIGIDARARTEIGAARHPLTLAPGQGSATMAQVALPAPILPI